MADIVALLKTWLDGLGLWGPLVFGLLYVAATLMFLPVIVLTITAGVLFGWRDGTLIVSLASVTSAALPFLIARYLTRKMVTQWLQGQPWLSAVDKALEHGSWKIIVLFRLSTVLPFSLQNYLFGLMPIGFWPYLIATWLAMLPGTFMFVYIGHATEAAAIDPRGYITAEWVALGVGLVATMVVSLYITALTKKKLREQILVRDCDGKAVASEQQEAPPRGVHPTSTL